MLVSSDVEAGRQPATHLIEVLQQVDYAALDFILGETGWRRIEAKRLRVEDGDELGWANSRSELDLARSRGTNGARNRSSQRAHDSRAKHCGGLIKI